jgi:hypothetical protein
MESEVCYIFVYDIVYSGRYSPAFWRKLLLPSSGFPEYGCSRFLWDIGYVWPQGATSQKPFTLTAIKTWKFSSNCRRVRNPEESLSSLSPIVNPSVRINNSRIAGRMFVKYYIGELYRKKSSHFSLYLHQACLTMTLHGFPLRMLLNIQQREKWLQ